MRGKSCVVLLTLLCVLWAWPLAAGAYELRMDETLDAPAPAVATVSNPAGKALPAPSIELAIPYTLLVSLLISIALYFGWRQEILKFQLAETGEHQEKKRQHSRAGSHAHKRSKPPARMEHHRKTLQGRDQFASKATGDLAKAKKLVYHGYYNQAEHYIISALRSEPYNLDIYVVALKVLSYYQTPQLIGLIRGGLQLLRLKNPGLWHEVAKHGRKLAPDIENWDDAPELKRNS